MELYQLVQFKAMAETGNMTDAAEKLCVSQPALSMTLKKLEGEFGVRLFDRNKKNIILNDAGKLLLERTKRILNEVEVTQQMMHDFSRRSNVFVLGCVETAPMWFFQSKWIYENGLNSIDCKTVPLQDVEKLILNGTFDAIITTSPLETKDLCCKHLVTDVELLAVPASSPLANKTMVSARAGDVKQLALCKLDGVFYQHHMQFFQSLEKGPEVLSFPSLALMTQYTNESNVPIMASLLSYPHHPEFKERKVVILEDPELLMRYYVVYRKSARTKILLDYLFKRADEAADFIAL